MEILEVLPDLILDEKIVIEDEMRAQFLQYSIEKLQPQILSLLSEAALALQKSNASRRRQVITCFHAWMLEETSDSVKNDLPKANLLPLCFRELQLEGENNEEASDAIIACMVICKDAAKYQLLYQTIISGLFEGKNQFNKFVENGNEEEVKAYVSVYSHLTGRVISEILNNPLNESIVFMLENVFLKALKQKKREIVIKAVSSLTSLVKRLEKTETTTPEVRAQIDHLVTCYQNWFNEILMACCEHCKISAVRCFDHRNT